MTIDIAMNNYLINSKETKSIKTYIWEDKTFRSFKMFCVKHKVKKAVAVSKFVLLDYIGFKKERNLMNSTLNKKIKLVKRMIVFNNIKPDLLLVNTFREKKHTVDRLSEDELEIFLMYLDQLDVSIGNNFIYKTLYKFILDTGERIDDTLHIKKENIELKNKIILLEITKYSKERFIDFSSFTCDDIEKLLKIHDGEYLFWNMIHNKKLDYDSDVQYFYRKFKKETGLMKLTAHRLRHTFASITAQNGMNVLSLKEILGHENIRTIQIYMHVNRNKIRL